MILAQGLLWPEGVALTCELVKVASPYRESKGWRDSHF